MPPSFSHRPAGASFQFHPKDPRYTRYPLGGSVRSVISLPLPGPHPQTTAEMSGHFLGHPSFRQCREP